MLPPRDGLNEPQTMKENVAWIKQEVTSTSQGSDWDDMNVGGLGNCLPQQVDGGAKKERPYQPEAGPQGQSEGRQQVHGHLSARGRQVWRTIGFFGYPGGRIVVAGRRSRPLRTRRVVSG
jgi:hypothetical protein